MDELWQRYRTFWMPLLIGLGVFLVGLIAVHVVTDDPAVWQGRVQEKGRDLSSKKVPERGKIENTKTGAEALKTRVDDWTKRLDQAGLADPLEVGVSEALRAAILRGQDPDALRAAAARPDDPSSVEVLRAFDGDDVAASHAVQRFEQVRTERVGMLRTGDPNVGFVRLLSDVSSELDVRANRADVALRVDNLGFQGASLQVSRVTLPQRVLNLALIAEVVDLAIRNGADAIDDIRFENRANPDVFVREWPVTFSLRGDMAALRPILSRLTRPDSPYPLLRLLLSQPRRSAPEEGIVQLEFTASSVELRPNDDLDLATEGS
jgi:hypothetical protein